MFSIKKIDVADNERVFLFKKNRFVSILEPGSYRYWNPLGEIQVECFDITCHEFNHPRGKFLVSNFASQTESYLEAHQLSDDELGLLYRDGQLVDIVAPGSFKVFWKGLEKIELKRINLAEDYRVPIELLGWLGRGHHKRLQSAASQSIYYTEVEDNHVAMLLVNGQLDAVLSPGSYGFWKYNRHIVVKSIDLRLQNMEVNGQEILTKDRVSLRLNLSASYRVTDPQLALAKLTDFNDYLYREFQLLLREAVGTRSLNQLLNDKDGLNKVITDAIRQRVVEYGIEVKSVGVRDIILPGEMKVILNQVVEAEKAAEANLIKRREETAATRSLHNTAKMMEGNPTLMRLKELEVLEKVTESIDTITVHSGLEGLLKDLVRISPVS